MQLCKTCQRFLILPPSIITLQLRDPKLAIDESIDRSIPRCKHCDALRADGDAVKSVLPSPTFENPIKKYELGVEKLRKLIEECDFDEDDKRALQAVVDNMRLKWGDYAKARDRGIRHAWGPYTAIWGQKERREGF